MSSVELDYKLRQMQAEDLPTVLKNERVSYSHPWSEGIFSDCIESGYECWLLIADYRIIGHGILSVAASEAHLLNACVRPDYQGNGFGKIVVKFMLNRARERGARRVYLEVRPSNRIAYRLYENLGFNEIGVRKDYYPAFVGREDALVLAREILS